MIEPGLAAAGINGSGPYFRMVEQISVSWRVVSYQARTASVQVGRTALGVDVQRLSEPVLVPPMAKFRS